MPRIQRTPQRPTSIAPRMTSRSSAAARPAQPPPAALRRPADGFEVTGVRGAAPLDAKSLEAMVTRLALEAANAGLASGALAGGDARTIAFEAAKLVLADPDTRKYFAAVLPQLVTVADRFAGPQAARLLNLAGRELVKSGATRAILAAAAEIGGAQAKRLVGAAMRGYAKGGTVNHVVAEVAATAAKAGSRVAAKHGAKGLSKILAKAVPFLGNAVNIATTVAGLVKAIKVSLDPTASKAEKVAAWLHLATSVGGIFIPWIGMAGDLGMAGFEVAKLQESGGRGPG